MTTEPIGRRVAMYRKSAGFKSPADLAARVQGGSVTTSTIQNIESGRKKDLTVTQLVEIAVALDIPPIALIADLNLPDATGALPAASDQVKSLTNWDLVHLFSPRSDFESGLGGWLSHYLGAMKTLMGIRSRWRDAFRRAEAQASMPAEDVEIKNELGDVVYVDHHDPKEFAWRDVEDMAREAQSAYDKLRRMSDTIDLSWAEGPWLEFGLPESAQGDEREATTDSDEVKIPQEIIDRILDGETEGLEIQTDQGPIAVKVLGLDGLDQAMSVADGEHQAEA